MEKVPLGRSDLRVSPICLGTMTFGGSAGIWAQIGDLQQADAERLIGQAIDAGINFIDTAEMYPVPPSAARYGDTERFVGDWLRQRPGARQRIVLATNVAETSLTVPGVRIVVDGGFRRGSDVLKAIALGADGVMIGRPTLYGLAAGGQPGVAHALQILRSEMERVMMLLGCRTLGDLGRHLIRS